jgi:hypothetical protein
MLLCWWGTYIFKDESSPSCSPSLRASLDNDTDSYMPTELEAPAPVKKLDINLEDDVEDDYQQRIGKIQK